MLKMEIGGQEIHGIVFVQNPKSSKAELVEETIEKIKANYPKLEHKKVITSLDPNETVEEIEKTTECDDLVCVAGGEGTVNLAAKAYMTRFLSDQIIPHFILPGGSKNDLASSIYSNDVLKNPIRTILTSTVTPIYLIEFSLVTGEGVVEHDYAVSYGGFGGTAEVSSLVNLRRSGLISGQMRKYQSGKFVLEAFNTFHGLATTQQFSLIDHNDRDQPKNLSELSFINGSRMAGGVISTPVEVNDTQSVKIEQSSRLKLFLKLADLAIMVPRKDIVQEIDEDFTLTTQAKFHIDAEPRLIVPETRVKVSRSSRPFYVLSNL